MNSVVRLASQNVPESAQAQWLQPLASPILHMQIPELNRVQLVVLALLLPQLRQLLLGQMWRCPHHALCVYGAAPVDSKHKRTCEIEWLRETRHDGP